MANEFPWCSMWMFSSLSQTSQYVQGKSRNMSPEFIGLQMNTIT